MRQEIAGSELVSALERAWATIRRNHPEVPPAVLITGSGSLGRRGALRLGHFAASRWHTSEEGALCEVFIGGEGLTRGARAVLATELHEATHGLAFVRGIKDTSRQGRYHNRRFKALAEELGLQVDHDPRIGWSPTTLPDSTARRYRSLLAELERALVAHRDGESADQATSRAPRRNPPSCVCACGRRIRIAPATLAQGPVICSLCSQPFRPSTKVHRPPRTVRHHRRGTRATHPPARALRRRS